MEAKHMELPEPGEATVMFCLEFAKQAGQQKITKEEVLDVCAIERVELTEEFKEEIMEKYPDIEL